MTRTGLLAGAHAAALLLGAVISSMGAAGLPNPFFAMDTGTRDARHQTPEAQAKLLKELGYAGIGWSPGQVPEMLAALDREGLRLFTVYAGLDVGGTNRHAPAPIVKLIQELEGRDTILWLYVTSTKYRPSEEAGDAEAVAALTEIAALAKRAGVKVALYPHSGFWLERVQDAVRLAKKVNRARVEFTKRGLQSGERPPQELALDNLGVTFNLCHCLKVGDEKWIPELLEQAKPHLFVVTINGADHAGDWNRLIQTLDRGEFDVLPVLRTLKEIGFRGPIGLQHYGIPGDVRENLKRSMDGWRRLSAEAAQR